MSGAEVVRRALDIMARADIRRRANADREAALQVALESP